MFFLPTSKTYRSVIGILSSRGLALGLQVGLFAVVGRTLGVNGLGMYQLFVSWLTIIGALGAFGAPTQSMRDVSVAAVMGDHIRASQVLKENLKAAFIGVGILAGIVAIASHWIQSYFIPIGGPSFILLIAALAAVFFALLGTIGAALRGLGKGQVAIFLESGFVPLFILTTVGLVIIVQQNISVSLLLAAHALGLFVATTVAIIIWQHARRKEVAANVRHKPNGAAVVNDEKRSSRKIFGATQGLNILANNLAIIIMPFFLGPTAIGLYAIAWRLVTIANKILGTLSALFAPRFAQGFAKKDVVSLGKDLRRSQVASLVLFVPLFMLFVIFPQWVLSLFGPGFREAGIILIILATGQLLNSATGLVGFFLNMVHRERAGLVTMLLALFFYLIILLTLGPILGVIGVAFASAVFLVSRNVMALWWCLRTIKTFQIEWNQPIGSQG